MSEHPNWQRRVTAGLSFFAVFVIALVSMRWFMSVAREPTMRRWDGISVGDSEVDVRDRLGEPARVVESGEAGDDYYVPGYRRRERPVSGRALVYFGADLVLYVWIDHEGRVEDKFIGGS